MFWSINERFDVERQVVRAVAYEIARGAWAPGDAVPAPHVLAKERILNPRVVESAYAKLVEIGLLVALPDGGHQTSGGAQQLARDRLVAWAEDDVRDLVGALRRAGVSPEAIHRVLREGADA